MKDKGNKSYEVFINDDNIDQVTKITITSPYGSWDFEPKDIFKFEIKLEEGKK